MTNTRPRVVLDGHYTMTEASLILQVDRKTIFRWRKCGYMKHVRSRYGNRIYVTGREILKMFELSSW